jgi:prepilin-type N-terminal cleavage/methylation domain-containing protein
MGAAALTPAPIHTCHPEPVMRRLPKPEGFTLIELLMVIVIIGVLAVIASSVFWRAKSRGFEAAMQSDLKAISVHQEHYFEEHSTYAPTIGGLTSFTPSDGVNVQITHAERTGWAAVATHTSALRRCGLFIGAAPANIAAPAEEAGIVQCGEP